LTNGKSL